MGANSAPLPFLVPMDVIVYLYMVYNELDVATMPYELINYNSTYRILALLMEPLHFFFVWLSFEYRQKATRIIPMRYCAI